MPRIGPFDISTQTGDPLTVGNLQLTPFVRLVQVRRLESVVTADQQRLVGFALVMATPVAVRVLDDEGERRVSIPDPMLTAALGLLAGFVLVPLVSVLVTRFKKPRAPSNHNLSPEDAWN